MTVLDTFVVLLYLLVVLYIGFFFGRNESSEEYLVNDRNTRSIFLVFTIASTGMGMGTFLGVSSTAYSTGISYGITYTLASVLGLVFVAFFAPMIKEFGDTHKAHTLGDWFEHRYSRSNKLLVAVILFIAYFFWMGLQFVGVGGLVQVVSGMDFKIALVLSSLVCVIYTAWAGIRSDFYTDAVQFVVIVITLYLVLLPTGVFEAGDFVSSLPPGHLDIFAFGGPSFFFGGLIFGLPIFLVCMEVWQRGYAASGKKQARNVFLWSALILAILYVPALALGLIARKLLPSATPDFALYEMMKAYLPSGIFGLSVAGVLAIAMSCVNSMILVGSITLLKDVHITYIRDLTDQERVWWGRLYTLCYGVLGIVAAYLIPSIVKLQIISAATLSVMSPAIIGGFLWKRGTADASFWSILPGLVVTLGLYPFAPSHSFIPGMFVSVILYIGISMYQTRGKSSVTPAALTLLVIPFLLFPSSAAARPVKIGLITDLSGRMAHWGTQSQRGARVAVEDLKAEGIDLTVVYEDAVLDSMKAVSAAQKLLQIDNVDVLYTEFSPISVAAGPVAKASGKIFVFDAGASSPLSTYEYAFKSYIDYISFCREAMLRWKAQGITKAASLRINAEPGEHCEIGLKSVQPDVLSVPFNQNDDLASNVMVLKKNGIQATALAAFEPDLLNLLRAVKNLNYSGKIAVQLNAAGAQVQQLYSDILPRYEFFGLPPVHPEFLKRLRAEFPDIPETSIEAAAVTFLHIRQMARAVAACDISNSRCIAEKLSLSPPDDVIGFMGWKNRVAQFKPVFWKWRDGGWNPDQ